VEEPVTRRERPAHLICRSVWAVIATLGCAYFAYLSYTNLRDGDFLWQHQLWNSLTWAVWTALATGLATETRCWRERILFTLLVLVFVLGLVFSLWVSAPFATVRDARIATTALWTLATVISLVATVAPVNRGSNV
jgi:hypothetical protein